MSPDLREGQTLGAYRLIGVAGTGGMGVVYRAEQRPLGRIVALKVIRPEIAESGDYRERFLREARLAAAVDHPHIVTVFDFGEHAGRLYLTMQWIDGVELQRLIDRLERLDPARAVRIGTQIASALGAIHGAGMLHRDVKPANIMVRTIAGEDHAYLTDFGLAKVTDAQSGLTRTGWMIGTWGYLSPEQIRGEHPDARSDLYALGCVMFVALTGQHPFAGANDQAVLWAHVGSPRPVASQIWPGLGRRYDDFLIRALAVDPDDRFQSGRDFAAALDAAHARAPGTRTPTYVVAPEKPEAGPQPSTLALGTGPATAPAPGAGPATAPAPATRPATAPAPGAGPATAPAPVARGFGPAEPAAIRPQEPTPAGPPSGAVPPGTERGATSRARGSARGHVGRLAAMLGALAFLASVTVLHHYSNNGTGWKSMWEATHGDLASPLYAKDFWISAALAGFVLIGTAATIGVRRRLPMAVVTVAALGLTGYALYIPTIGASPGFGPYGTSYWLSFAAAVVMTLGAAGAAIRSGRRGRLRPCRGEHRQPAPCK